MTREDAIRILKDEGHVDGSEEFIEAYYMGIKALEDIGKYRKEARRWKRKALMQKRGTENDESRSDRDI